jgi:hypothetical protein
MSTTAELGTDFAGELVGPDDAEYDAARALFNAMIDKRRRRRTSYAPSPTRGSASCRSRSDAAGTTAAGWAASTAASSSTSGR